MQIKRGGRAHTEVWLRSGGQPPSRAKTWRRVPIPTSGQAYEDARVRTCCMYPVSLERHGLPAMLVRDRVRLLVGVILPHDRWWDTSLHCSGGCYPPRPPLQCMKICRSILAQAQCVRDRMSETACTRPCVRDRESETVCPRPCVRDRVSETVCPRPRVRDRVPETVCPRPCVQ